MVAGVMDWIEEESCWLRSVVIEETCGLSWEDARGCAAAALRPRKRGYWREYWSWWGYRDTGHRWFSVVYRGQRISGISLARRKPGVQIPSPPPHNSPGHRPGGLLSQGRCRSRVAGRAANGQQPRTKRPRCVVAGHDDVVKRGQDSRPSDCESVPTLPPGPAPDHPGCSGARAIPSSAVLWGLVLAPGLPERLPLSCVAPV